MKVATVGALMIALPLPLLAQMFSYTDTVHLSPKYYMGQMPLSIKYTIGVNGGLFSEYSGELMTLQMFEGGENIFVYADPHLKDEGIPNKAFALDLRHQKLAEATLLAPIVAEKEGTKRISGWKVREVHYAGGRESFVAECQIDPRGSKISEVVQKGQKTHEYFFLWPLEPFHEDKVQEVRLRNR